MQYERQALSRVASFVTWSGIKQRLAILPARLLASEQFQSFDLDTLQFAHSSPIQVACVRILARSKSEIVPVEEREA